MGFRVASIGCERGDRADLVRHVEHADAVRRRLAPQWRGQPVGGPVERHAGFVDRDLLGDQIPVRGVRGACKIGPVGRDRPHELAIPAQHLASLAPGLWRTIIILRRPQIIFKRPLFIALFPAQPVGLAAVKIQGTRAGAPLNQGIDQEDTPENAVKKKVSKPKPKKSKKKK
mgnify:CR=1 FL=1